MTKPAVQYLSREPEASIKPSRSRGMLARMPGAFLPAAVLSCCTGIIHGTTPPIPPSPISGIPGHLTQESTIDWPWSFSSGLVLLVEFSQHGRCNIDPSPPVSSHARQCRGLCFVAASWVLLSLLQVSGHQMKHVQIDIDIVLLSDLIGNVFPISPLEPQPTMHKSNYAGQTSCNDDDNDADISCLSLLSSIIITKYLANISV